MATVGADIRAYLAAQASVTAYVSSGTAARIHENTIPQTSDKPYIWYRRSNQERMHRLETGATGYLIRDSFDIECHSMSVDQARAMAEAVKNSLDDFSGTFGSRRTQGVDVLDHDEDYIPKGNAGDQGISAHSLGVEIWYAST